MLTHPFRLVLAIALGVVSCSREDTTPNPNTYALGVCNRFARCAPAFIRTYFGDVESCTVSYANQAQTLLSLPGAKVTRSQINACVRAIDAASCSDDLELIAACDLRGDRANEGACSSDAQCSSGSCFHADVGVCGVCRERAPLGAPCESSSCARGLVCHPKALLCVVKASEGEPCLDVPCRVGLGCRSDGSCVAPRGVGEVCDSVNPCDGAQGLVCEGACTALIAKPGEACDVTPFCERGYCADLTCHAHQTEGASCSASVECELPLECVGGVCARAPTCP